MKASLPLLQTPYNLEDLAKKHSNEYAAADPFPHIVLDNIFHTETLRGVLEEFPGPREIEWERFKSDSEKKLATNRDAQFGPKTRAFLYQLNSHRFLSFLQKLTGIQHLIPDPYFFGGGIHQIERGGFLKVHADFNYHIQLKLYRRLNVLIYLNEEWKEGYGGHLELWDTEMTKAIRRVLPIFNRCVIFSTTSESYHGHPEPLTCPEDRTRKSLALYYYTAQPAEDDTYQKEAHNTLFMERPGEKLKGDSVKQTIKKFIPPIIFDLKSSLSNGPK